MIGKPDCPDAKVHSNVKAFNIFYIITILTDFNQGLYYS